MENVNKTYLRDAAYFYAIQDANLEINAGDFITIIGKSGSGKSTLLSILAGILKPTSGKVRYDQMDFSNQKEYEIAKFRNEKIGYVGQGYTLLPNLTVYDNIRLAASLYKKKGNWRMEIEHLLERLGIAYLKNSYPKQLSGGEMRRASIARALVNRPQIILADEPTGDLDEQNTKIVLELFYHLSKKGMAVIMVTHDKDALEYANRKYEMKNGILYKIGGEI